jgi:hypothetical protein
MNTVTARSGWLWIKEGLALFRKQPAELASLFFGYVLFMIGISIVPILGQVLPLVLIPVFSMVFLQASALIDHDRQASLTLLPAAFRSPYLGKLLLLGVLYLLAMVAAVAVSSVIDGGLFWQAMTGQITPDEKMVQESNMTAAMIFAAVAYTPAAMAFWYAAPLIAWQGMPINKALFYSFFSVLRALKAFFVYVTAWMGLGVLLPSILSTFLIVLTGMPTLSMAVLLPVSLLLTIILYCTFYPTYTHVFGKPDLRAVSQDDTPAAGL